MDNKRMKRFLAAGVGAGVALLIMIMGACNQPDVGSSDTVGTTPSTNPDPSGGGMVSTLDFCLDGLDDNADLLTDRYGKPEHCTIGAVNQLTTLGSVGKFSAVGTFTGIEPDVYTVLVTTGGGFGVAQIIVTSRNGDVVGPGLSGPVTVVNGVPLTIGTNGVILYFVDTLGTFNLVANESWTFSVMRWTNCLSLPDPACAHPNSTSEDMCSNSVDDDGDGLIDAADPQCTEGCSGGSYLPTWISESVQLVPQCSDGIDNNLNGKTDFPLDTNCTSPCDNSEFVK